MKLHFLLVTFALRNAQHDYNPFFVAIRGNSLQWWHFIPHTAVVVSQWNSDQFAKLLVPHIINTDSLLVVELTTENQMQGWLPPDAWDWLNKVSRSIGQPILPGSLPLLPPGKS